MSAPATSRGNDTSALRRDGLGLPPDLLAEKRDALVRDACHRAGHRYGNATLLESNLMLGIGDRWANRHTGSVDV